MPVAECSMLVVILAIAWLVAAGQLLFDSSSFCLNFSSLMASMQPFGIMTTNELDAVVKALVLLLGETVVDSIELSLLLLPS